MSKTKAYIFYLNLPDDLNEEFDKEEVDRFYEVKDFLLRLTKFYNEDMNRWYYLYAFTDKKKYADIFEDTRNMNIFIKKVVKFNQDDYNDFKRENTTCKLKMYNYNDDKKSKLLCTKDEIMSMEDDFPLILDAHLSLYTTIPYEILKQSYVKSLDRILYCLHHKVNEDDADDYYSYNYSFGITPENATSRKVSMVPDKLSMYIRHFGILLKK